MDYFYQWVDEHDLENAFLDEVEDFVAETRQQNSSNFLIHLGKYGIGGKIPPERALMSEEYEFKNPRLGWLARNIAIDRLVKIVETYAAKIENPDDANFYDWMREKYNYAIPSESWPDPASNFMQWFRHEMESCGLGATDVTLLLSKYHLNNHNLDDFLLQEYQDVGGEAYLLARVANDVLEVAQATSDDNGQTRHPWFSDNQIAILETYLDADMSTILTDKSERQALADLGEQDGLLRVMMMLHDTEVPGRVAIKGMRQLENVADEFAEKAGKMGAGPQM